MVAFATRRFDTINRMDWWHTISTMERVTRVLVTTAIALFILALITWPITWFVAIPAAILSVVTITFGLFSWFRLDDLRGRRDFR